MISNAQKAVLHIAKGQLQLEDEMYRAILREQGGVDSSSDLTNAGFDKVIRRFEQLGFTNTSRRHRRPEPNAGVTAAQQQLIAELYDQLGWSEIARQIGFSKHQCGRSWPQTRNDANKVIEGLKVLLSRSKTERA